MLRLVFASLVVPLLGCGAATGVPDDLGGTGNGARPSHDAATSAPTRDATRPPDGPTTDATLDARPPSSDALSTDALPRDATSPVSDGRADASMDAVSPDAAPDASPGLNPDERLSGEGFSILGVTDGGLLIYGDRVGTCWAMPFAGGTPVAISTAALTTDAGLGPCTEAAFYALVSHDVVLMSNGTAVYSWTAALGAPVLFPIGLPSDTGSPYGLAGEASADSRYIVWTYLSDFGPEPYTEENVDGSGMPTHLDEHCSFDGLFAVCGYYYGLARFLNALSLPGSTLVRFTPVRAGYSSDEVGGNVLYPGVGGLTLAPLDGTPSTILDPAAVTSEYLAPDGSFAMYVRPTTTGTASELVTLMLPGGTPQTVGAVPASSYFDSVNLTTPIGPVAVMAAPNLARPSDYLSAGYLSALLATTPGVTAPSLPSTTCEIATYSPAYENGFTADGSFLLLVDEGWTRLEALPLTGSSAALVLSTTSSFGTRSLTGSRVLFFDAFEGKVNGVGDLRVADLSLGSASTLVVSRADQAFALSPDRSLLAYTLNQGTSADGLYVVSLSTTP